MDNPDILSVIAEDVSLLEVEPHIYSVYAAHEKPGAYDGFGAAAIYDRIMCNPLYNRVMWGYGLKEYTEFTRLILDSSPEGWVLDVACGSLAFTSSLYADYSDRPVILLDQSLNLLGKAKARLVRRKGSVPPNLVFLHADALNLPFRSGTIPTVISLNLLHCLEDMEAVLREWKRVSTAGGSVAATTLIRNNRWGDGYLNVLSRTDQMFSRGADQLCEVFQKADLPAELHTRGNLALIHCRKTGG